MLAVCVQSPDEVFRFCRCEKSLYGCKVLFECIVGREVGASYVDWGSAVVATIVLSGLENW